MANFKVSNFFSTNLGPSAGWSESYYATAVDNIGNAVQQFATFPYLSRRLNILHPAFSLEYVRVVNIDVPRQSKVVGIPSETGKGQYPAGNFQANPPDVGASEQPWDCLLLRMETQFGDRRRMMKLHGLPNGVLTLTYAYNESNADWSQRFNDFRNNHVIPNWKLQGRTVGDELPVASISVNADRKSITITGETGADFSGYGLGDYLLVKNYKGASNINKLWRVRVGLNNVITTLPHRQIIDGTPDNSGSVAPVTYALSSITSVSPERGSIQKVGAPFGQPHGHVRARP